MRKYLDVVLGFAVHMLIWPMSESARFIVITQLIDLYCEITARVNRDVS